MTGLFAALAGVLGLLWGSFLNVVIWRLPKTRIAGLRRNTPYTLSYLALPLSHCPACKTPIKPWHNVPLLSYALLGGRSRCCGRRISWMYPVVELGGVGIVWLALAFSGGEWMNALLIGAFLSLLLVNAAIDWRRFYLLDVLSYPLLWLGLLANIDARFALLSEAVLGAAGGYAALALFAAVLSRVVGRTAMGMGDFKLFAAIGAWVGWQALPWVLFIGAVLGVVFGMARQLARGRGRHIPFGPALAVAGALMLLCGDAIQTAYWEFVLG